jgi:hypothetical protein
MSVRALTYKGVPSFLAFLLNAVMILTEIDVGVFGAGRVPAQGYAQGRVGFFQPRVG